MADAGAAYAEVKDRLAELVGSLSPDELAKPVPACPAWTVQDVLAHHIGVMADVASGSLPEIGDPLRLLNQWRDPEVARDRDAETAREVAERRGRSVPELLAEWDTTTTALTPALSGQEQLPNGLPSLVISVLINDVVVHEGDIREALGLDVAPEVLATSLALAGYGASFEMRLRATGLPAIAFSYNGRERVFGMGQPAAILAADRTTMVRLLASRLDEQAIRSLDWTGDPTAFLGVLPEYGPVRG